VSALAFGKTEVTNLEWNTCVKSKGCDGYRGFPALTSLFGVNIFGRYRENNPVTNVTWRDAVAYVTWLSIVTKQKYRLPTEAEWEYAARAKSKDSQISEDYPFPIDKNFCQYANGADESLKSIFQRTLPCNDGYPRGPAPVGTFIPNAFGLHDMHGNVWEWVDGCWGSGPTDPGATDKQTCDRIARGGSWRSSPSDLKSSSRTSFREGHARSSLGFRVVRELTN
jgi:formylglycine-generating enzyme required for sulfatase activity